MFLKIFKIADSGELLRRHWALALVLGLTFVVYGRIIDHQFIATWDDNLYVSANPDVHGFSWDNVRAVFTSYYAGNYAPVQMLSYMIDYEIWGLKAGGYLFNNILLHAGNGILFYWLLLRLHGSRLLATYAAALFLLHPVQVESVAWVSQRKNLLAMLFFLIAWLAYCRYREGFSARGGWWYAVSLVSSVLALFTKSVTVILPVVLIGYDWFYPAERRRLRLPDKLPYLLAAGGVAALAMHSQLPEDAGWSGVGGGRTAAYHGGSPQATFFSMLPVFCRYLRMLVFPADLSAQYRPTIYISPQLPVVISFVVLVTVIALSVMLYRHDSRLGLWPALFFLGLLPVAQIVPLVTMMNDRYLYFPMLGVAVVAGVGADTIGNRFPSLSPRVLGTLLAIPVILLAVVSFQRSAVWENSIALWRDAVTKVPHEDNWKKLGDAYYYSDKNMKEMAMQSYLRALETNPYLIEALYSVGALSNEAGDYATAYDALTRLLAINANHVMGRAALGYTQQQVGKVVEAEKSYSMALALQPDSVQILTLLGDLALGQGEFDKAREFYGRLERQGSAAPDSAFLLACTELRAGQSAEAYAWLEKSLHRGFRNYSGVCNIREFSRAGVDPRFAALLEKYSQR